MKQVELLRAIYNDKEVLKKIRKSIDEYALNQKSMDQLKRDSKEIEKHIKEALLHDLCCSHVFQISGRPVALRHAKSCHFINNSTSNHGLLYLTRHFS